MRKNALNAAECLEILQRLDRGESIGGIAKAIGHDNGTVKRFLDREGIKYKLHSKPLTKEEKAYILEHYRRRGHKRIAKEIGRSATAVLRFYREQGLQSGLTGRFQKGRKSPYKGKTLKERGYSDEALEAMRATQFKEGHMPHNHKPIGSVRVVTENGEPSSVMVKVGEGIKTESGHTMNYRLRARVVWEENRGPIPEGHVIVHANGDPTDDRIENLRCIPMSVNAVINHEFGGLAEDDELSEVMIDVSTLKVETSRIAKKARKEKRANAKHTAGRP